MEGIAIAAIETAVVVGTVYYGSKAAMDIYQGPSDGGPYFTDRGRPWQPMEYPVNEHGGQGDENNPFMPKWAKAMITAAVLWEAYDNMQQTVADNRPNMTETMGKRNKVDLGNGLVGNVNSIEQSNITYDGTGFSKKVTMEYDVKHTVKSGECLSVLAEQYGTTTKALATLNGIKDINDIKAGQVLKIGTYTTTYTVKASAAEYKASQGLPNDATTVVK